MKDIVYIISEKEWNKPLLYNIKQYFPNYNVKYINNRFMLDIDRILQDDPEYVFFPHWSYIIPEKLWKNVNCVVFHMTDLPFGRGGSPLQNLIIRGYTQTKISALKVEKGIDTGDIYLKRDLDLSGNARDIFRRANTIIEDMIVEIIKNKPVPVKQVGDPVLFKRRTPEESNIEELESSKQIYDYIRMLDADGYPKAFIITSKRIRYEFFNAAFNEDGTVLATVKIISNEKNNDSCSASR